jgi:streptogramin lyase
VATNYDGIQLLRAGTSTFDSLSARPHDSSALALGADGTIYVAHVGDTGRPVIALLNAGNLLDLAASSDPRAPDTTKPPPTPDSATQPLALSIQHVIPVPSGRQRLLVNGGRAFVGTDTGTDLVVIDTTTAQEVRRISTGPTSALAAGFGSIWSCGMTEIRRIDPTAATLSTRLPIKCTFGITAAFGSLWVAGHNEVRRYSPAGVLQSTIPIDGGDWGIAAGADSIWVAYGGAPGPGPVTRIDPTTNTVRARIPVATRTREIAVTEAAVWVTTEPAAPGDPSLVRIDPTTNTTRLLLPGARDATGIAVDSTHVWVADHGGGIAALDPTTTMALGTARPLPNGTTAGGNEVAVDSAGHLWATVDRPGALMQLLDS